MDGQAQILPTALRSLNKGAPSGFVPFRTPGITEGEVGYAGACGGLPETVARGNRGAALEARLEEV